MRHGVPLTTRHGMETNATLDALVKQHAFLAGLPAQFCEFLTECATIRRFASKQQVFDEGSEADHFYLIVTGGVRLETYVPGNGMVPIQQLGPGDPLGWSWLFPPFRWNFTAVTTAPTEVISFSAIELRAKAVQDLEFRNEVLTRVSRTLLQRLQATRRQLVGLHCSLLPHSKGEHINEAEQKSIAVQV
jgi:CRP/FNR family transcriptional regulator, cyclic AMP receptor protein